MRFWLSITLALLGALFLGTLLTYAWLSREPCAFARGGSITIPRERPGDFESSPDGKTERSVAWSRPVDVVLP